MLYVTLVHPLKDLLVEGAVVEGLVYIEYPPRSLTGGLARVMLFECHVECGDGAEGGYEDERDEYTAHEGGGGIFYSIDTKL